MRVLYLYPTPRIQVYQKVMLNNGPNSPLYGLNYLREFGTEIDFFDEDRTLGYILSLAQRISGTIVKRAELGWNIGQAFKSLKRFNNYDLIFACTDSTGLPLAFLKKLGFIKTPLIIASQGLCQSLKIKGWNWAFRLHRWSLESVNQVVFYGWAEGIQLHDWFRIPKSKLAWLPVGADNAFFSAEKVEKGLAIEDIILSVGRDRCRDYELLLKVARKSPLRFRIITSQRNLAGMDIPDNVEVLYDVNAEELRRYYASSRLIVLPVKSSSYSFATTVFLESLSMQKPVIVSRTDAVGKETDGYRINDNIHCRFVPVGDGEALQQAIEELWCQPHLCKEMGRRGKDLVEKEYNTHAFADRLYKLFESVK